MGGAVPTPQEPDWLFCGSVVRLTCGGPTGDARMLLEGPQEHVLDVWLSASLREDLMARLGERYHQRHVCVAREADLGPAVRPIVIRHWGQLTVREDPTSGRRGDVFSTCDPSVQLPTPVRNPGPLYTPDAMRERVSGALTLNGIVEVDGHVTGVRVVHSLHEGLDAEAMRAFARWQFQPARRLGDAVAVAVTAEFTFRMAPPE